MPAGPNPAPSSSARLTPGQRWFSVAELALGTFLVIGHNVYHIVPNEVPFLFVLFWISLTLRDGGWKVAGLRRPDSWKWSIIWALAAAVLRISLGEDAFALGGKSPRAAIQVDRPIHAVRRA